MDEIIRLVESEAKASRKGMVFLGGFMIVLGAAAIWFLDAGDTSSRMARRAIFGGYVLPIAGLLTIAWALFRKPRALELLRGTPDRIVWCFTLPKDQFAGYLGLGSAVGKKTQIALTHADLEKVTRLLAAALPHATHGFSPELLAQFDKNPNALRK
jgi:hypothetical protein